MTLYRSPNLLRGVSAMVATLAFVAVPFAVGTEGL